MPYVDYVIMRRVNRATKRTKMHGNWRQTLIDYDFMCGQCESPQIDDLHEPFGEVNNNRGNGNGKMQARIPLCVTCHSSNHNGNIITMRKNASHYLADTNAEIEQCGSVKAWMEKYGLTPKPQITPAPMP